VKHLKLYKYYIDSTFLKDEQINIFGDTQIVKSLRTGYGYTILLPLVFTRKQSKYKREKKKALIF